MRHIEFMAQMWQDEPTLIRMSSWLKPRNSLLKISHE